jgi:hypothetical protein
MDRLAGLVPEDQKIGKEMEDANKGENTRVLAFVSKTAST